MYRLVITFLEATLTDSETLNGNEILRGAISLRQ